MNWLRQQWSFFKSGISIPTAKEWIALCVLISVLVALTFGLLQVVKVSDEREEARQATTEALIDRLEAVDQRVERLEGEKQALTESATEARNQAQTSVDQLVRAGEVPIIVAPDAIPRGLPTPVTTTTTQLPPPPVIIVQPPSTTTTVTEPPPTETTTTTTETPTTTVLDTTTTTVVEPPVETTTTLVEGEQ